MSRRKRSGHSQPLDAKALGGVHLLWDFFSDVSDGEMRNHRLSRRERNEATTPVTKLKLAWARFGGQRFGLVLC